VRAVAVLQTKIACVWFLDGSVGDKGNHSNVKFCAVNCCDYSSCERFSVF